MDARDGGWGWIATALGGRGRIATALVAAAFLAIVLSVLVAGTARADFTVHTCGGAPAPAWSEGVGGGDAFAAVADECTTGGGFGFLSGTLSVGKILSAGVVAPAGEAITHVSVGFHSSQSSGGGPLMLQFGYGSVETYTEPSGDKYAGTSYAAALPDADDFFLRVVCPIAPQQPCDTPTSTTPLVTIDALDLTMHDTGVPAVSAPDGTQVGTYRGLESLVYNAGDGGSGVARVTASLGSTVVGSVQISCQSYSLAPCPHAASGTVPVNTRLVKDGTYPVILTAYDASGDPASVTAGSVKVRNHSRTVSLPAPKRRNGAVRTRIAMGWRWNGARTTLTKLTFSKLARTATVTVSCVGRRCPFTTRRSRARHVKRLERRLRGTTYRVGQRLQVTVSQPHLRSERGQVRFRRGRVPMVRRG